MTLVPTYRLAIMFLFISCLSSSCTLTREGDVDSGFSPHRVTGEQAFQHAVAALVEAVVFDYPRLIDGAETIPWQAGRLGEPELLHDIDGTPLVYAYPVTGANDQSIGQIWVAADKSLGATLVSMGETQRVGIGDRKARALEIVHSQYPGWIIRETIPVIYSYPHVGFMMRLQNRGSGERRQVIIDAFAESFPPVESHEAAFDAGTRPRNNSAWSFFDAIPDEEKAARIHAWASDHAWALKILEMLLSTGADPDNLKIKALNSTYDMANVAHLVKEYKGCEEYAVPVPVYCQSAIPFCTAAAGRMIAGYYGVYQSEAQIGALMNISTSQAAVTDELNYFKHPQGMNKSNSVAHTDPAYLTDWTNYRQVLKNRISSSQRNGGHSWVLAGMVVCSSPGSTQVSVKIGKVDPYPSDSCPKQQSCNTYKVPACAGELWDSFWVIRNSLKGHVIPYD